MAKKETAEQKFNRWMETANQWAGLLTICNESPCVKQRVIEKYKYIFEVRNSADDASLNRF